MYGYGFTIESLLFLGYLYFPISCFIKRKRIKRLIEFLLESIFILIGIIHAQSGNFQWFYMSMILSIIYFPMMIWMTSGVGVLGYVIKLTKNIIHLSKIRILQTLLLVSINTLVEELIWRVSFSYLLCNLNIAEGMIVILGSILFTLIHWSPGKEINLWNQFEFLLFSVMLYLLFLLSGSLPAVWFVHFIRNILIKFYYH